MCCGYAATSKFPHYICIIGVVLERTELGRAAVSDEWSHTTGSYVQGQHNLYRFKLDVSIATRNEGLNMRSMWVAPV